MPAAAIALLLTAAVAHATWNYLAKGATGSIAFTFVFTALANGVCIGTYTLWDNKGVSIVTPVLYNYGLDLSRAILMAPIALATVNSRAAVAGVIRDQRRALFGVALLSPAAYILVLAALTLAPVSYVAPAREISILIGALLGLRLLGEADAGRRIGGALAIVAGVFALALG